LGWAGLLGWGSWSGDCRGWGYWCGAAGVVAVGSVDGANGTGAGAAGPGAGGCCSGRGLLGCDCRGGVAGAVTEGMGVAGAGSWSVPGPRPETGAELGPVSGGFKVRRGWEEGKTATKKGKKKMKKEEHLPFGFTPRS